MRSRLRASLLFVAVCYASANVSDTNQTRTTYESSVYAIGLELLDSSDWWGDPDVYVQCFVSDGDGGETKQKANFDAANSESVLYPCEQEDGCFMGSVSPGEAIKCEVKEDDGIFSDDHLMKVRSCRVLSDDFATNGGNATCKSGDAILFLRVDPQPSLAPHYTGHYALNQVKLAENAAPGAARLDCEVLGGEDFEVDLPGAFAAGVPVAPAAAGVPATGALAEATSSMHCDLVVDGTTVASSSCSDSACETDGDQLEIVCKGCSPETNSPPKHELPAANPPQPPPQPPFFSKSADANGLRIMSTVP